MVVRSYGTVQGVGGYEGSSPSILAMLSRRARIVFMVLLAAQVLATLKLFNGVYEIIDGRTLVAILVTLPGMVVARSLTGLTPSARGPFSNFPVTLLMGQLVLNVLLAYVVCVLFAYLGARPRSQERRGAA